jgi:hypothetical protein
MGRCKGVVCRNVPQRKSFYGTGKTWHQLSVDEQYELDWSDVNTMMDRMKNIPIDLEHNNKMVVGRVIDSYWDEDTKDWIADLHIDGDELTGIIKETRCAQLSLTHNGVSLVPLSLSIVGDPARKGAEIIEASQKKKNKRINNSHSNDVKSNTNKTMSSPTTTDLAMASNMGNAFDNEKPIAEQQKILKENLLKLHAQQERLNKQTGGLTGSPEPMETDDKPVSKQDQIKSVLQELGPEKGKLIADFLAGLKGENNELNAKLSKSEQLLQSTKSQRQERVNSQLTKFAQRTFGDALDKKQLKKITSAVANGEVDISNDFTSLMLDYMENNERVMNENSAVVAASKQMMIDAKNRRPERRVDFSSFDNAFSASGSVWNNPRSSSSSSSWTNNPEVLEASSESRKRRRPNDGIFRIKQTHGPSDTSNEMAHFETFTSGGFDKNDGM